MAFSSHFYHASTRKIIIAFGVLFREIPIIRPDASVINVPLAYGSKQKWYSKLRENPDLLRANAITLPRIGFTLGDFVYNPERKLSSTTKIPKYHDTDTNKMNFRYQSVPWDINVNMFIWSKTMDDGLQIIEQILPFFKPSFNITIQELTNGFESKRDIPITLNSVGLTEESEGDFLDFKIINWDLNFTCPMNYHNPTKESAIIKKVYVDYHIPAGEYTIDDLDTPTEERYSALVDPETATQVDSYDILEELELFPEGDPVP